MQLTLNDVQEMIQDNARRFFSTELDPLKVRAIEDSADGFSPELWAKITELGWNGLALPESNGGGGLGLLELSILIEEAAKAAASSPLLVSSGLAATCLQALPASTLVNTILNKLATTDLIASVALIDSGARSERAQSSIVLEGGSGAYTISGRKQLVPFATVAGVLLVTVSTANGEPAIVAIDSSSKYDSESGSQPGADGLIYTRHTASLSGDPMFQVAFNQVSVTEGQILARGEAASTALDRGLEVATLLSLAEATGACEEILRLASEHAKVREQFGQAIGSFQAVSHPLAEMRIHTDVLGLLAKEAAWMDDQGKPASFEIASAKVFANDIVADIALEGHRLHGAIGYSSEYDLQLYTRRAKAFSVAWGDTDSQVKIGARALGLA